MKERKIKVKFIPNDEEFNLILSRNRGKKVISYYSVRTKGGHKLFSTTSAENIKILCLLFKIGFRVHEIDLDRQLTLNRKNPRDWLLANQDIKLSFIK